MKHEIIINPWISYELNQNIYNAFFTLKKDLEYLVMRYNQKIIVSKIFKVDNIIDKRINFMFGYNLAINRKIEKHNIHDWEKSTEWLVIKRFFLRYSDFRAILTDRDDLLKEAIEIPDLKQQLIMWELNQ